MKIKGLFTPIVGKNVFIGSKGRLSLPVCKSLTGATLFIEPQEVEKYREIYEKDFSIVTLEDNDRGFAYLLNQMVKHAKEMGYEHFVFCDDDILGFKFREKESLNYHINKMIEISNEKGYSQVMMSFAGHNWYYEGKIKENIGAWCFIVNKTSDILEVGGYNEEIEIFNDWEMSARLITFGKTNACYYDAMFVHKMNSQKGGAEYIYKKQEKLNTAIDYLQEKFGKECTKVIEKNGLRQIRFNWNKLKEFGDNYKKIMLNLD